MKLTLFSRRGVRRVAVMVAPLLLVLVVPAWTQDAAQDPIAEARQLVKQGKYADAEKRAADLLAELEARGEADASGGAAVLDVLVEARWRGGKAREPETRSLAERAVTLREKISGPEDASIAESLNNLATVQFFGGAYAEAQGRWERALAIRTATLGPEHPDTAQLLNNLGNLFLTTGDFDAALPRYERALVIRRNAVGAEHPLVAQSLNNLAVLRTEMGDYAAALPLSEQALAMYEKLLPAGHPKIATSMAALARVLLESGESERALAVLDQAEKVWEKALGPEHPSLAAALNNHADELRRQGRFGEARPLYERARAILEKAYGPEHVELAGCLAGMGALAEAEGDIPAGIALQRHVVAIKEKALGPDHPRLATSLTDLGRVLAVAGEDAEAARLLERAVSIRRASLGDDHPDVADSLIVLAAVEAKRGPTAQALAHALESERIAREHLRLTARSFSERHALRYAAARDRGLDLALGWAATGRLEPTAQGSVLDALIRSRAVVLDGIAARHHASASAPDPAIQTLVAELAAARSRLANLTVRGVGDLAPAEYRTLLDGARERKEVAERALAAASSAFAVERERGRVGIAEVAGGLPPRGTLVAFATYRATAGLTAGERDRKNGASYVAFVLRADQPHPTVVSLGPAVGMDRAVKAWKNGIITGAFGAAAAEAESAYRAAGTQLRERLWDPIAPHLGDAERVFLIPDGALNLVSAASLPMADGGYLIETGPALHYLAAERDLIEGGDRRSGEGILIVGNADYGPLPAAGGTRPTRGGSPCIYDTLQFEPLLATAREAEEVARIWRSGRPERSEALLLSGANASEATLKSSVAGRRYLHLATHGFFLGGDCAVAPATSRGIGGMQPASHAIAAAATAQAPAGDAQDPPQPLPRQEENPLLLAGLALAGANLRSVANEGDDGVLTAEEIASLDLSSVDLAVLSACDTGLGAVQTGEGVVGLRRALQIAGARSLVLSLWPVDDETTNRWMSALYVGLLQEGLDPAEATRRAGLAVLKAARAAGRGAHPFYWAAFVATGP